MLDKKSARWRRVEAAYREQGGRFFEEIMAVLPDSFFSSIQYPTSTIVEVMLVIDKLIGDKRPIQVVDYKWPDENPLNGVVTVGEAIEEWGAAQDWLKARCRGDKRYRNLFEEGTECRKTSHGMWLITREALVKRLGESEAMKEKRLGESEARGANRI